MSAPFEWQSAQWSHLRGALDAGRMPHALLLRGPPGVGKQRFAEALAETLLCSMAETRARPCGACQSCRLFRAGAHPDFVRVGPEADAQVIKIGQIRELIAALTFTRQVAPHKVAVVSPAEAMQRPAANSLLKTLEEPPGATVFVLVAHHGALLPATIRSRCQRVDFPVPPAAPALRWLQDQVGGAHDAGLLLALASGAPLRAAALAEGGSVAERAALLEDLDGLVLGARDPVQVAQRWKAMGEHTLLHWLALCLADLVRLRFGAPVAQLTHRDLHAPMQRLAQRLDLPVLFGLLDHTAEATRALRSGFNPNPQLLVEGLAIAWRRGAGTG